MRIGGCQRAVREAYDAGESVGCWVGEEGLEDGVPCYSGSTEDEGGQGNGGCGHLDDAVTSCGLGRQSERYCLT
jgi:hypothetical protein